MFFFFTLSNFVGSLPFRVAVSFVNGRRWGQHSYDDDNLESNTEAEKPFADADDLNKCL